MNCKDTDKMIPLFLTDQLNNKDLDKFLNHVNKCEECMEELTIQYLVMIGASILEEGKSFPEAPEQKTTMHDEGAEKTVA